MPVAKTYDVKNLLLFGSYATGKQKMNSDIDFFVDFKDDSKVTLLTISGLKQELEESLGKKVDIVTLPIINSSLIIDRVVPIYG